MPDTWLIVAIAAGFAMTLAVVARASRRAAHAQQRQSRSDVERPDSRDSQLAMRLARIVGCTPAQALPAMRREIDIAPHQSDEILLKRAAYHYRRDLPEQGCPVFRNRAPG